MIISVTNRLLCKGDFLEQIEKIARASPQSIILREKDLTSEEYEFLAARCLRICNLYKVPLVINSFIDVALKLKIHSIHLPIGIFIKHLDELRNFQQIGVSVHSVEEAKFSEKMGANYLIAGHIFETACKKGVPPASLDFLKQVCDAVAIPVFAIGGIDEFNSNEVSKAGAKGICIMSKLMTCENPKGVLTAYNDFKASSKK